MMSTHTQGPWRIGSNSVGGPTITTADKRSTIADIRTCGSVHCGGPQHPETNANARLIAAAPDLLDALCEMIEGDEEAIMRAEALGIPFPEEMLGAYKKARAAIAKATGDE